MSIKKYKVCQTCGATKKNKTKNPFCLKCYRKNYQKSEKHKESRKKYQLSEGYRKSLAKYKASHKLEILEREKARFFTKKVQLKRLNKSLKLHLKRIIEIQTKIKEWEGLND